MDDTAYGERLRSHAGRTDSVGQAGRNALREAPGGDWLTDVLWNGFARARFGASMALVGSGASIARALAEYADAGIDTFILSGYRHDEEAQRVGRLLLPLVRALGGRASAAPAQPSTTALSSSRSLATSSASSPPATRRFSSRTSWVVSSSDRRSNAR